MCCCSCTLIFGVILAFILFKLFCCKKCCKKKEPELLEKNYKQDVVYLYQFPRMPTLPNGSPYCLAIESFLRLNKINYESRYTMRARSKYGLLPFIELNGVQIADSQLIEEHLKRHFNIKSASEYEESVARAVTRLVSHHTSRVVSKFRYIGETEAVVDDYAQLIGVPEFLYFLKPLAVWFLRRKATKGLKATIGLFSNDEFNILLRKDLDALKGLLGAKEFFLGDKISNVDAILFGFVAVWYYQSKPGYLTRVLFEEYPVIVSWADRVRDELFPNDFTQ